MAYEALQALQRARASTFRFVSNVDGTDFAEAVRDLDPAETLFIVSSKTFTTLETMTNAATARAWSLAGLGGDEASVARHFVAVSTNAADGEGVRHRYRQHVRVLGLGRWPLLDGVGDRSLDDGRDRSRPLPRTCSTAPTQMDEHFRTAPFDRNLPVLHGPSSGSGTSTFFGAQHRRGAAVRAVPEAASPLTCSSSTMESNGKHVHARWQPGLVRDRRRSIWGEPGTNGQHSFYQLIHQGTRLIPCDFIAFAESLNPARRSTTTSCCANVIRAGVKRWPSARPPTRCRLEGTRRLARCRTGRFQGNRPSNTLLARAADAGRCSAG